MVHKKCCVDRGEGAKGNAQEVSCRLGRVLRKVLLWPQSDPSSEEEEEKLEPGPFKGNNTSALEYLESPGLRKMLPLGEVVNWTGNCLPS